jgi:hypothetical protein
VIRIPTVKHRFRSFIAISGFVVEMGDKAEFGSFAAFQDKILVGKVTKATKVEVRINGHPAQPTRAGNGRQPATPSRQ